MGRFTDGLWRPEYTGRNRCWPCTAVNVTLVGLVGAAAAVVGDWTIGTVVVGTGLVLVWRRGYVVPYTPRFAPRLARRLPGDHFGERRRRDNPLRGRGDDDESSGRVTDSLADDDPDGEAVLSALVEAGVVVPDDETLRLTEAFRTRWHEEMSALRGRDPEALTAAVGGVATGVAETEAVESDRNRVFVVLSDGTDSVANEIWLSRPVAIAEVAAVRCLEGTVPEDLRLAAAGPLRMFLQRCPACEGTVEESTTVDCCGGTTTPLDGPDEVLACRDCGERLYTF